MAYNNYFPMGYQGYPQSYPQAYPQNQSSGVVWVQGIEGAKAHPVAAGQAVLLMDSDSNCLYLKSADASGMPSLRIFDYTERTASQEPKTTDMSAFALKDDLDILATKEELKNVTITQKRGLRSGGSLFV